MRNGRSPDRPTTPTGVVTAGLACDVSTIRFNPASDYRVVRPGPRRSVLHSDAGNGGVHLAWTISQPGDHGAQQPQRRRCSPVDGRRAGRRVGAVDLHGVDRRCLLGDVAVRPGDPSAGTVRVYDDYGHHPTVDTTLRAREAAFRPGRPADLRVPAHQHSRTRFLLEEFAQSFSHADIVIVPHHLRA